MVRRLSSFTFLHFDNTQQSWSIWHTTYTSREICSALYEGKTHLIVKEKIRCMRMMIATDLSYQQSLFEELTLTKSSLDSDHEILYILGNLPSSYDNWSSIMGIIIDEDSTSTYMLNLCIPRRSSGERKIKTYQFFISSIILRNKHNMS